MINVPGTSGGVWTNGQPPVIDGNINGDPVNNIPPDYGWTGAWRYAFNNGSFVHNVVVQANKDSNYLYMSFEVNHDTQANDTDVIVIAFDPTGADADRRILQIFPLIPGGVADPVVMYYSQGYPWTDPTGNLPPANTTAVAKLTGSGTNLSWFVELQIPRAAFNIPASGEFGLYFDVVVVNGPTNGPKGTAREFPWPVDTADLTSDLLNIPTFDTWGIATTAPGICNGVYITPQDIYTENTPATSLTMTTNVFHATVHNLSTDGTGTYIPVSGINATFKIASYGTPTNMWKTLFTTTPTTIGANSTADLTAVWTLTPAEQAYYLTHPIQAVLVELDAAASPQPWTTTFTSRSAWTNMTFGVASLTIVKSGTGSGSVYADSGLITWTGNTGTAQYSQNTQVTLTAIADAGSAFAGWSGACTGAGPCTLTTDSNKSVTAVFIDTVPPNAPTVTGISPTNDTRPTWSWMSGGGGNGTFRHQLDGELGSWTTTTALSYQPESALTNGSHTLYVQERDDQGNWSASGSFAILIDTTLQPPAAPTNLTSTLDTGVTLNWTDNASNENGYRVFRKKSIELAWTIIAEMGASAQSFTDTAAAAEVTYNYFVSAYNVAGSANTPTLTVTTHMLALPTDVATSGTSGGINLTWRDNSFGENGNDVWRRKSGETSWTKIASLGANAVNHLDAGATDSALYLYQVCATTVAGGNVCSDPVAANQPGGLTAVKGKRDIILAWIDNSSDETGFRIYRKMNADATFTLIGSTGANAQSYHDGTTASGTYFYRVCAYNDMTEACCDAGSLVVP